MGVKTTKQSTRLGAQTRLAEFDKDQNMDKDSELHLKGDER